MTRTAVLLFHVFAWTSILTGVVYGVMRYWPLPEDSMELVAHPSQPHFQHAHILLSAALDPSADHDDLAAICLALQPSAERLKEVAEQGAAFARTVAAMTGAAVPERPLPVAVGAAASGLGRGICTFCRKKITAPGLIVGLLMGNNPREGS
jgi:hypothetical protein